MGGLGSGNYDHSWRSRKRTVVEDCIRLDANYLTRKGILKANVHHTGDCRWVYEGGGSFSVRYDVNTLDLAAPSMRLSYSWVWVATKKEESVNYRIRLTTTQPRFGGLRWWFVCPAIVGEFACNRRVGKLYLPPGGRYFCCRHCHMLTYKSCQERNKRGDTFSGDLELMAARLAKLKARDLDS
jgi:hypothetical protein